MRKMWLVASGVAPLLLLTGAAVAISPDPAGTAQEALGALDPKDPAAEPAAAGRRLTGSEHERTIRAMTARKHDRPVVAVVGQNAGAETTDYVVPYGIIKRSGVADVFAVATSAAPLKLMPSLTIAPDASVDGFDKRFPEGADYVIVPALHKARDPAVIAWIRAQAGKGAVIVGICSGVQTVAAAGLLKGRRATGHWHDLPKLESQYPEVQWTRDRRYVADRGIVTTTGITASVPVSLAIVEAIAGRAKAAAAARELGVSTWTEEHDGTRFRFEPSMKRRVAGNLIAFWNWETFGLPVEAGVDEVSLALTADAWSRTYRSKAVTVAQVQSPIRTRGGLMLIPDATLSSTAARPLPSGQLGSPGNAVPVALSAIAQRYGTKTARFVAAQLEYP